MSITIMEFYQIITPMIKNLVCNDTKTLMKNPDMPLIF